MALVRNNVQKDLHALRNPAGKNEKKVEKFEDTTIEDVTIGFIHIDVKYLPRMKGEAHHHSCVFVAIDRVSRYVVLQVRSSIGKHDAAEFLEM